LAAEDNGATQRVVERDSGAFARSRRLSGDQLFPVCAGPCPGCVLIDSAVAPAENNHGINVLIEYAGRTVDGEW
jgi:hypothetical protein